MERKGESMEGTTREILIRFTKVIDFLNFKKEWIDVFERKYENLGEIKPMVDEVINDDDSILTGMLNVEFLHMMAGGICTPALDVIIFILYFWWKKNVIGDKSIANEFPEEI